MWFASNIAVNFALIFILFCYPILFIPIFIEPVINICFKINMISEISWS